MLSREHLTRLREEREREEWKQSEFKRLRAEEKGRKVGYENARAEFMAYSKATGEGIRWIGPEFDRELYARLDIGNNAAFGLYFPNTNYSKFREVHALFRRKEQRIDICPPLGFDGPMGATSFRWWTWEFTGELIHG